MGRDYYFRVMVNYYIQYRVKPIQKHLLFFILITILQCMIESKNVMLVLPSMTTFLRNIYHHWGCVSCHEDVQKVDYYNVCHTKQEDLSMDHRLDWAKANDLATQTKNDDCKMCN